MVESRSNVDEARAASSFKIVIVDDNVDAANTLAIMLDILGHKVCVAHDGRQAIKIVSDFKPDVVFLDIGMPDMDGYEVAMELRKMVRFRPLVLVALTGWGTAADRARAARAGFDHHLTKPASLNSITTTLFKIAEHFDA